MEKSKIDWTESTWNPVSGCFHNCPYCYARRVAGRFKAQEEENTCHELLENPHTAYPYGFDPTLFRHRLNEYKNKKARNIFVCSMGDLFGEWVPDSWLDMVFEACEAAPQHNYLFLTKNPGRYTEYHVPLKDNYWYGTTVTCSEDTYRCDRLPAFANLFLSIEPLMDDVAPRNGVIFRPNYTQWVIVGAETGSRKIIPERGWVENIVAECRKHNTPVFLKNSLAGIWGKPLIQEYPKTLG